jgi:hypothetical protein
MGERSAAKTAQNPFFKWVFTAPGQQKLSIVWGSPGQNGRKVYIKNSSKPFKIPRFSRHFL